MSTLNIEIALDANESMLEYTEESVVELLGRYGHRIASLAAGHQHNWTGALLDTNGNRVGTAWIEETTIPEVDYEDTVPHVCDLPECTIKWDRA